MPKNKGLGRGLDSLFGDYETDDSMSEVFAEAGDRQAATATAPLSQIYPNPDQPRKNFDPEALNELAASIKTHGIISPLIVVKRDNGYMIIAGERRWRAAKLAGLTDVPVLVKAYTEQKIKEISLIENLQREDLSPIEAANAIRSLMVDFGLTQEAVADRLGKSRPAIANTVRLLSLATEVISLVGGGKLSAGHAKVLLAVKEPAVQIKLARAASDNKMTVRDLEKAVNQYLTPKTALDKPQISLELRELVNNMQVKFGTKVAAIGNDHKGRIYIDYYTRDDLDRLLELINSISK
jgi:ParB family chromosome partitioning protein